MADANDTINKEEKLKTAKIEKDKGNEYFKAGDINKGWSFFFLFRLSVPRITNFYYLQ